MEGGPANEEKPSDEEWPLEKAEVGSGTTFSNENCKKFSGFGTVVTAHNITALQSKFKIFIHSMWLVDKI